MCVLIERVPCVMKSKSKYMYQKGDFESGQINEEEKKSLRVHTIKPEFIQHAFPINRRSL